MFETIKGLFKNKATSWKFSDNTSKQLTPIRHSANKFTNEKDIYFDPKDYSMFKFGCKDVARRFGIELAQSFMNSDEYKKIKTESLFIHPEKRIIVISSPYVHIPTATFAMKDYFIRYLNHNLVHSNLMPVLEAKMYRKSSYKEEYGEMNKEQRFAIMEKDVFHIDKSLIQGNICLFLDDIVITGAHEHRVKKMLEQYNIQSENYFLYFAELSSHETNPIIENYLNYAFVKNLVCLDKIIKNENFLMNTRVVKYILDAPFEECKTFLTYQKQVFLQTLYHNAIGNGYHLIDDYSMNLGYLKSII